MNGTAGDDEPIRFASWSAGDETTLGLFFFEVNKALDPKSRMNLGVDRPSAVGMGALISADGLVVTCSHVVLALAASPGAVVSLFGASHSVCIEVSAEVCAEGWLGPPLDEVGRLLPHPNPDWHKLWDERPDVFREDLAFLRIIPNSARWNWRKQDGAPLEPGSAQRCLLENARVLPFSACGYRGPGALLRAWCVNWIFGAPDCQSTEGTFRSVDGRNGAFHAVRLSSGVIRPGFSGGPLWDNHRGTIVGVVRRALPALQDLVLGTDARAFAMHPSAFPTPDVRYQAMHDRLLTAVELPSVGAWSEFVGSDDYGMFIEPELTKLRKQHPLVTNTEAEKTWPAVQYLLSAVGVAKRILLRGGAGAGKSILLRRVVAEVLRTQQLRNGRRLLPLLVSARELQKNDCDVERCLEQHWAAVRPIKYLKDCAVDVLAENGASLVLFVDGLDEVPAAAQGRLLARLGFGAKANLRRRDARAEQGIEDLLLCAIVSSRPHDKLVDVAEEILDLRGFDGSRIDKFCRLAFPEEDGASSFREVLKRLRWAHRNVPPLQLRMAAAIFKWDGALPERAVDLTARYVRELIERAKAEFGTRHQSGRRLRDEVETYVGAAEEIFAFAAAATLGAHSEELTEECFQQALDQWSAEEDLPGWALNVGSLTDFVYKEFQVPLASVAGLDDGVGPPRLEWAHRTFVETLSALHIFNRQQSDRTALRRSFDGVLKKGEHGQALAVLGVIDRAQQFDTVEAILNDCMLSPAAGSRPQLFALRALAAGIDANAAARSRQVTLLIRFLLSDIHERISCAQIFSTEDLPDAQEILGYPELRADIFTAMEDRLRFRLARSTPSRPATALKREALILQHSKLWPEFTDRGLRPTQGVDDVGGRMQTEQPRLLAQGGVAHVVVFDDQGKGRVVDIPAENFVSALATVARATDPETPLARLIELTVSVTKLHS